MTSAFCLFENGKSYDALQIAKQLGRTGKAENMIRWVREHVFSQGCWHYKLGNVYITTGDHLNLWINQRAEGWNDDSRLSSGPGGSD
ncbi:hypothetical protein KOR34_09120 [Posidoniimonas corsicana]|uniref:Uncharacterized protein n=1 Tax=Posidoniimonas corsicana TaxID=1938618 RepID=A0A5C5VEB7_9BACT|nr:hypothetical protein [Posidoniimonas corsicana]TWT36015.1 hypothetical protein KOR34_09120 [Posidoniimonas corsicana]